MDSNTSFLQPFIVSNRIWTTAFKDRMIGKQDTLEFNSVMETNTDWKSLYKIVS
jgi:hypothetical protein